MKRTIYAALLAVGVWTCVEPFEPEIGSYERTLVVDAVFTNSEEPSKVYLSRSFDYGAIEVPVVTGAQVLIEDDQGNSATLEETKDGTYETNPALFPGQIGRSYRLIINTPDGNRFESTWELMKAAPSVETIEAEFREQELDDPLQAAVPGLQLQLSTRDTENNTRYYRWEFEETYQYLLRYPPFIGVEFGPIPGRGNDEIFEISGPEFEGFRCWKTEDSRQILVATTENLTEDVVEDFPLHFVSNKTPRLAYRYSILVKQYAISKENYEFLNKVKEINQTTGSLFDAIPNEVFGNISSSDGKNIPVLGYFSVAGLSTKRAFFDRQDTPFSTSPPFGPSCLNDTIPLSFITLDRKLNGNGWVLYDYHVNDNDERIGYLLSRPPCTRCAGNDATNIKPDFW
ncbi:MAG: DUF4249 domain-containing protein [Saprospiraceae bacterium]|nr:DUF4249 domain-containing protein [Saprospiraceae bacterium]